MKDLLFLQHKHNPDNNWETPFDFTDDNYEIVSNIAVKGVANVC